MKLQALDYVVVVVAELGPALAFYTEVLGLPLKHRAAAFAQLDTGRTRLALYERGAMRDTLGFEIHPPERDAPGFELGFLVDDVDRACAELVARGVELVTPPTDRAWGQRTAYIRDPDGHLLELAQQLIRR